MLGLYLAGPLVVYRSPGLSLRPTPPVCLSLSVAPGLSLRPPPWHWREPKCKLLSALSTLAMLQVDAKYKHPTAAIPGNRWSLVCFNPCDPEKIPIANRGCATGRIVECKERRSWKLNTAWGCYHPEATWQVPWSGREQPAAIPPARAPGLEPASTCFHIRSPQLVQTKIASCGGTGVLTTPARHFSSPETTRFKGQHAIRRRC